MIQRRKPILRKTRLSPVSKKRQKDMKTYAALRKEFLAAHPWCQVWLAEHGVTEDSVWRGTIPNGGFIAGESSFGWNTLNVPAATEVHHREKRGKNYLNVSTWMAVSNEGHRKIHNNPSWARERGYLK